MSYTYGQPQRWQSPDYNSRAPQAASFANTMPTSAFSARDEKKKKKDKSIKVVGPKPAEEVEEEIKTNEMSPTIKYVELHRHGSSSWTLDRTIC
jgi:hypothetical protein